MSSPSPAKSERIRQHALTEDAVIKELQRQHAWNSELHKLRAKYNAKKTYLRAETASAKQAANVLRIECEQLRAAGIADQGRIRDLQLEVTALHASNRGLQADVGRLSSALKHAELECVKAKQACFSRQVDIDVAHSQAENALLTQTSVLQRCADAEAKIVDQQRALKEHKAQIAQLHLRLDAALSAARSSDEQRLLAQQCERAALKEVEDTKTAAQAQVTHSNSLVARFEELQAQVQHARDSETAAIVRSECAGMALEDALQHLLGVQADAELIYSERREWDAALHRMERELRRVHRRLAVVSEELRRHTGKPVDCEDSDSGASNSDEDGSFAVEHAVHSVDDLDRRVL